MEQFLTDDDLLGLLEELDQEDAEIEELEFEWRWKPLTAIRGDYSETPYGLKKHFRL